MRINAAFVSICLVVFGASLCMSQSNAPAASSNLATFPFHFSNGVQPKAPAEATNWGPTIQGVRLSITMTNSVVELGTTNIVVAVITNFSTNFIELGVYGGSGGTGTAFDFDPVLTNGDGKLYHLVPPPPNPLQERSHTGAGMPMHPGEQCVWLLSVPFGKAIEPGDYMLQATRGFTLNESHLKLESNLLKVRIK